MRFSPKLSRGLIMGLVLATSSILSTRVDAERERPDPTRFEKDIQSFAKRDANGSVPEGAVLVIGSSSFRMWTDRMKEDLEPLTLVPLGFGGSQFCDAIHYFDQLVVPYKPRAVMLYEGDNDIASGLSPMGVARDFLTLATMIHDYDPAIRIYVVSVKPSPKRLGVWGDAKKANALMAAICEEDARFEYVDVSEALMTERGEMRPELYIEDGIHLNADGYDQWARAIRDVVVPAERPFEKAE